MASAFFYQPVSPHAFADTGYATFRPTPAPVASASSPVSIASRTAKRKHCDSSDDDDADSSPDQSRSPTPKRRRRCATIERGFEDLTLVPPPAPFVAPVPLPEPEPFAEEPLVEEPDDVLRSGHPYSYYPDPDDFEEVVPRSREVRMHNSGWYEPEKDRIVITDLDASDSEADDGDEEGPGLMVSPSLLDALKRSSTHSTALPLELATPTPTSALVLFRPAPWNPPPPVIEVLEDDVGVRPPTPMPTDPIDFEPVVDVDLSAEPMDVDMMDVEDL